MARLCIGGIVLGLALAGQGCGEACYEVGFGVNLRTVAYQPEAGSLHAVGRSALSYYEESVLDRPDRYWGVQVNLDLATLEHRVREKTTHNPPRADLPGGAAVLYRGDFNAGIGGGAGELDLDLPDGRHTVHVRADESTRPALIERGSYGLMLVQVLRAAEIRIEFALGDGHVDWLEPESGEER